MSVESDESAPDLVLLGESFDTHVLMDLDARGIAIEEF